MFELDGEIHRSLSADGLADFRALLASGLLDGDRIISTELLPVTATGGKAMLPTDVAGVVRHARAPFVSYAYEWTFSMLRDAALLQLDLMLAALEHDLILKDASPYNVQFDGAATVFIDIGPFERLREEEPWVGHHQFCMLYLFPLLLQATKGFPFQPLPRGSPSCITWPSRPTSPWPRSFSGSPISVPPSSSSSRPATTPWCRGCSATTGPVSTPIIGVRSSSAP